jgi:hypothetical protein
VRNKLTNRLLNSRKSCAILCAGFLIFISAVDVCLAGHTQNILLTGYWPPTNEMLRKFSTDPVQNPGGWQGQNWEGRGYDIYAFFPEFPGGVDSNPKGNGDFEIDYQDVGSWSPPAAPTGDFWRITSQVHPVAIMSYGMDSGASGTFEMEYNARNLSSWSNDYLSPTQPTPAPPDTGKSTGYVRNSSLPIDAITEAINSSGAGGIKVWVDWTGNPGAFLCEYMAYHDGWYQNLHSDPNDQYYCIAAGFTHVAGNLSANNGTAGVEAALRALINNLDSQLIHYTVSGNITYGGSPLVGVTMCGLPGNPVTNASGFYTAQVGGGWSGAVTPLKSGYAFSPSQRTYSNVRANQSSQNYTADSATADTIQFDAASSTSSSSASTTLSWSHTIGSGNNRILIVSAICEDSTPADQIMSSVKFNGVNMTPVPGSIRSRSYSSSSTLRTELYYMLNPPISTSTVTITYNGSVSYRAGGAVSLRNVKQQAPEAVVTNAKSSATAISTDITIPNSGAWIVDVVGHSNSGSFTSSTTTERWDRNSGYHTGAGGTKAVTSAGLNTISWTYSGSSGSMVHSLVAFAPSETVTALPGKATGPSPANGATNVGVTTDLIWAAGSGATSHDVYFGTVSPGTFQGNQTGTIFDTGTMSNNTIYYWHIDEKNAGGTTTGDVWSFTTIYKRTLTSSSTTGGDVNVPGEGSFQYDHGTVVDIVATAEPHYHFVNWTGTAVTAGKVANPNLPATTVLMDANYTVAANFGVTQFTIIASAGPNGSINPSGAVLVNYGASQDFNATPNVGYEVNEWYLDGNGVQSEGDTYTLSNITADHTVYVTFRELIFTISGYVLEVDGNTAVEGVLIQADDNDMNTVTDANGFYELWVDYNWSGIITPQKKGYVFEPNGNTYTNVTQDYSDGNYIATLMTFKIAGYVLEQNYVMPISDVNVSAENGGGTWTSRYGGGSDVTDANGYYEVVVDYNWSGKVTPSKYAYGFEPNSRSYAGVIADQNDQDYTGKLLKFVIGGYIRNDCNVPIKDVVVTANNIGGSDTTDVNGFYEVWVDYNWSGTVTPSKTYYTFDPNSRAYTDVLEDKTGQDYLADNIYDLDCDGSVGFGDVAIIGENWLLVGPDVPGDIYKDEDNTVNFLDFADFADVWQED